MAKRTAPTWRNWLPEGTPEPDQLFTREEIVARATRRLVAGTQPIGVNDLRYWESIGILPRGVRRWRDGAPRALFPDWYGTLAREIRILQRSGYSLAEIKPRIRAQGRLILGHGDSHLAPEEVINTYPNVLAPEHVALWPDLVTELERLARWRTSLTGVDTERVEVHVIGVDGRATLYPLLLTDHPEETKNSN